MGDSDFLKGRVVSDGIQTEIGLLDQIVDLPASTLVEIALLADDIDFERDGSGNSLIVGRFFRGAFNLYRLRLNSGQVLHAFSDHTKILPVGARVQARVSAEHTLTVFSE
jgi:iron(III) transport system ATP-binding protein